MWKKSVPEIYKSPRALGLKQMISIDISENIIQYEKLIYMQHSHS